MRLACQDGGWHVLKGNTMSLETRLWGTKLFRQTLRAYKKLQWVHSFMPVQLRIEATKVCNLRCVGCRRVFEDDISLATGDKHLTVDRVRWLIEQVPHLRLVGFSGDSEPTCNPYLWNILTYLKSKGVKSTFTTNNTLLDENRIKFCEDCGVIRISVSQNGAKKETFENIRIGAKFDKVMENNYLIGRSSIPLFLNFPMLTKEVMDEVPEFFKIAKDVKATGVQFLKLQIEDGDHLKPLDFYDLRHITDYIKSKAKEYGLHLEGCLEAEPIFTECYEPVVNPLITLSGDVYPCAYTAKQTPKEYWDGTIWAAPAQDYIVGNVFKQSLKEIWFCDLYREIRKYIKKTSHPNGTTISRNELHHMRMHLDDNRFSYCKSCLVRWCEVGS